jgi:hypothetical protein
VLVRVIASLHIILSLPWGEQKRQNPPHEALANNLGDLRSNVSVSIAIVRNQNFTTLNGKQNKNTTVIREYEPPPYLLPHLAGRVGFRMG